MSRPASPAPWNRIKKRATLVFNPTHFQGKKVTRLINRDTTMKDQIVIAHQVHRSLFLDEAHLIAERLALQESAYRPILIPVRPLVPQVVEHEVARFDFIEGLFRVGDLVELDGWEV